MPRDKYRQASGGGGAKKRALKTTTTGDQTKGKAAPPKKRYPDTIRSPRSRTDKFLIGAAKSVNKLGAVGSALAGAAGAGISGAVISPALREATQKAAQNYQRTLKKK